MTRSILGLACGLALLGPGLASARPAVAAVAPGGQCGGYPAFGGAMAPGMCAGLVLGAKLGPMLRMPRTMVPLPGTDDWLVTDLGGWGPGRSGGLWRLTARPGAPPVLKSLIARLDMPHTVAIGPDGWVYVGEAGRILAFNAKIANPQATMRTVVDNLPPNELHKNRHPLSAFAFAPDGALLVNVGAPTDQCLPPRGQPLPARCAEAEGRQAQAVVRRYAPAGPGRWDANYTVFARGLRNSMAMLATPGGDMLQVENSIDLSSPLHPFDEVNLLQAGHNYGWPYCIDQATPAPGWAAARAMDCKGPGHTAPIMLLPPHTAPLGMTYYHGAMFPQLEGKLLVTFHGYEPEGARLVAYGVDRRGLPAGKPQDLTPGWNAKGAAFRGHPVGVTVAPDGAIWLCDDKNKVILRLAAAG